MREQRIRVFHGFSMQQRESFSQTVVARNNFLMFPPSRIYILDFDMKSGTENATINFTCSVQISIFLGALQFANATLEAETSQKRQYVTSYFDPRRSMQGVLQSMSGP